MQPPAPHDAHRWLHQLVGDWAFESDAPDPAQKATGTERIRRHGDLWIVAESQMHMPGGGTGAAILTIGYDPAKGRFVGTWVGTMMTTLFVYEGELDPGRRTLSLYCDGPSFDDQGNPTGPGTSRYRDAIEVESPDRRVFTGAVQTPEGAWNTFMTARYRRTS